MSRQGTGIIVIDDFYTGKFWLQDIYTHKGLDGKYSSLKITGYMLDIFESPYSERSGVKTIISLDTEDNNFVLIDPHVVMSGHNIKIEAEKEQIILLDNNYRKPDSKVIMKDILDFFEKNKNTNVIKVMKYPRQSGMTTASVSLSQTGDIIIITPVFDQKKLVENRGGLHVYSFTQNVAGFSPYGIIIDGVSKSIVSEIVEKAKGLNLNAPVVILEGVE